MDVAEHIDALQADGLALAAAAAQAGPGAAVPACPGWRVRDLLGHLGYVHRWAAGYVAHGQLHRTERLGETAVLTATPPDGELLDWFTAGHAALVGTLRAAPAGLQCWTFLPAPSPLAFWARRQAHETSVHRADAEQSAGRAPAPADPAFAADGIAELLAFFGRPGPPGPPGGGTLGLELTDRPECWTIRRHGGQIVAAPGLAGCDAVARGPAARLYLALWNRLPLDALEVTGQASLLSRWAAEFRITYG